MSLRPGVAIIQRENPPPRSAPSDTGVWFVTGETEKGPLEATRVRSLSEFELKFGARQTFSFLYDAIETYFREGGGSAYISRVVGPTPVQATRNLMDASAGVSLIVKANSAGAWGNALMVAVEAGTVPATDRVIIVSSGGVELERSPNLATQQAAVDWSTFSSYVTITLGASSLIPAVAAAAALSTGTDDRNNITDSQWLAALDKFTTGMGPGQVSAPGRSTTAAHTQLLDHAANQVRVAICDGPNTPTPGTLKTAAVAARAGDQRYGAMFAPWLKVPGLSPNTFRTVPPSALVAARIAVVDNAYNPNTPAAGVKGEARWATGVSQSGWSDLERDDLNASGVDVIREILGVVRVYGWRTLVDENIDPGWVNLGNSRINMAIKSQAEDIGEQYVFEEIDGQGILFSRFAGGLTGMLLEYYNEGALYGETAPDAFNVDVGAQVNTPQTIAAGELRAVIAYRPSPAAELVTIEIVKVAANEAVV